MKRRCIFRTISLPFLLLALVLVSAPLPAQELQPEGERWIGPGVRSYRFIEPETPLAMYVMEVDLSHPHITLELGLSRDRLTGNETVQSIADRYDRPEHWVIGAVNGDFWGDEGVPTNMVVQNGRLLRNPIGRSVFAMTAGKQPLIDFFDTRISIKTAKEGVLEFGDLNGTLKAGSPPILLTPLRIETFTPPLGHLAIVLTPEMWELHPQDQLNARVVQLASDPEQVAMGENEFGLVLPQERLAEIPGGFLLGDDVKIEIETAGRRAGKLADLQLAVGGGPRLLEDGQVAVEKYDEMSRSFNTTRHPRTAVGISEDEKTLYFVVVDGRQVGYSIGIDLFDLAERMRQLGAYQAVNLDGGGSSTMVVRGQTVNRPSDSSGDRRVSNCLMIVSTAPLGPVRHFRIEPAAFQVFPGQPFSLEVIAQDEYYNDVEIPEGLLHWSILKGEGEIDEQGCFRAGRRAGSATVRASVRGVIGSSFVSLEALSFCSILEPKDLRLSPQRIALTPGQEVDLAVEAQPPSGEWVAVPGETVRWRLKGKGVAELSSSGRLIASGHGRGSVEVRLGRLRARAELLVGEKRLERLETFSDLSDWRLTGTRVPIHRSNIQASTEQVAAGTRALRLDYDLRGEDGVAALYLNTRKTLPWEFESLSFQLYGNGCDHLFRVVLQDVDGERFVADAPGAITWNDEWRTIEVPFAKFTPHWANPAAEANAPFYLEQFYLVEPRTANKSQGTLFLDDLSVVYPPAWE